MQQCCQVLHTLASGTPEQRASVSQGTVGSRRERGDLERLLERLKGDEGT